MGKLCPQCQKFEPIAANIFKDLGDGQKGSEIIANKLSCGHIVGGDKYNSFVAECDKAKAEAQQAKEQADKVAADKMAALSKSFVFNK